MKKEQPTEESLQQIWERLAKAGYETDKFSVHSYGEIYEEILKPYRETAKNVLEIGLFSGNSLRMWEQYFTNAKVYGIDCDEQPHGGMADLRPMIAEGNHNIIIGDATNPADVEKYFKGIKFSVVIEDANHDPIQQQQIYLALKPYLEEGSICIIEDVVPKDGVITLFEGIDPETEVTILDRRHIKNRFDDCLIIIKN